MPSQHYERAYFRPRDILASIEDPEEFARVWPVVARIAREYIRDWPGIGDYEFIAAIINADPIVSPREPARVLVILESMTRYLSVELVIGENGNWSPRIGREFELSDMDKRHRQLAALEKLDRQNVRTLYPSGQSG